MSYEMQKNYYNTGTQLNLSNSSSLYPLMYFDFSFRVEKVTRVPKELIFLSLGRTLAPASGKTPDLSALARLASESASQMVKKISGNGKMVCLSSLKVKLIS